MTVNDLQHLYNYNYWANDRLFQVISQLTVDEFTRELGGSYGSVRNTLVHAMSAEWGWLGRCGGPERGPRLNPDDYPTLTSLIDAWSVIETNMRGFLAALNDDDLARVIEFKFEEPETYSRSLGKLLLHTANHSVHHRGQVVLMLRMLGYTPGDIDLLFYDDEK